MKVYSIFAFALLALSTLGYFGARSLRAESPQPANGSVVIPVKGMSCMACVAKTKRTLTAIPGVTAVEVKLAPGSATIKYDPAQVTPEKLAGAITGLGYQAGSPAPGQAQ